MRRIVVGLLLLLLGTATFVALSLSAISDEHRLAASPACAPEKIGPNCHAELSQTVAISDIEIHDHKTDVSIYVYGSSPELGWINLSADDADFARAVHPGYTVSVEVWHGHAVAITANGRTVGSEDNPRTSARDMAIFAGACGLAGFGMLRSASRTACGTASASSRRPTAPRNG